MTLKPAEQAYWERYLKTLADPDALRDAFVYAGYAGTPEITDELLALYFSGKKTAGSSLVEDFVAMGDPLPKVGNHWVYLGGDGSPRAILRTEKVVVHKFKDVPLEIALAEGEGDLSLEYWRKVHAEVYTPHLKTWGVKDLNEAHVITEYFTIVYR